jgi:hypothetical protein
MAAAAEFTAAFALHQPGYHALTLRASWFVDSVPWVAGGLVLLGLRLPGGGRPTIVRDGPDHGSNRLRRRGARRGFSLSGKERAGLRYAVRHCERLGIRFTFLPASRAWASFGAEITEVSRSWLGRGKGPEIGIQPRHAGYAVRSLRCSAAPWIWAT